jgi:hypothetical protein
MRGATNPTELAMLWRVLDRAAKDAAIEPHSQAHEDLAVHLLLLFEAVKDEERLASMIKRAAAVRRRLVS